MSANGFHLFLETLYYSVFYMIIKEFEIYLDQQVLQIVCHKLMYSYSLEVLHIFTIKHAINVGLSLLSYLSYFLSGCARTLENV